ncbi:MAG TPA: peptidase S41, partial [Acholeplasma sp.]|nr:peptidase S41 [Acholeplasma sp.]
QIKVDNLLFLQSIDELLKEGRTVEFKVKGNSMLPFFKHEKTIVALEKLNNYKKRDVVLAKYNDLVLLHRIIKIKDNIYTLRGDGLISKEYVKINDIYGKVVSFKTNDKKIKFYKTKVVIWLLLRPVRRLLLKFIKKG